MTRRTDAFVELSQRARIANRVPSSIFVSIHFNGSRQTIISGGEAYCWGSNDYGEIGDGTNIYRPAPTRVPGISGVTAVSTNSSMTCAVADGKVYCWGDGRL